jgi:hypothetical protein
MDRREAIAAIGMGSASAYGVGSPAWERFRRLVASGQGPAPFFSAAERAAVRVLVDMTIPSDEKSGGALDAGCLEYLEFVLGEASDRTRQAWHDGLRWLDEETGRRHGKPFAECDEVQRGALLDAIAWPDRVAPDLRPGADFFTRVRDLTGAAFFSSRMGVQDLGYAGNVFVPEWTGAPPEALRELGVGYEAWDAKYGRTAAQPHSRTGRGTPRTMPDAPRTPRKTP